MNISLDVHIGILASSCDTHVRHCLESVYEAVDRSPFPVRVHLLKGVPGNIGALRAKGYALGNAPYVTYVDDDDYIYPHAFEALYEALQKHPPAVFAQEHLLTEDGQCTLGSAHHALVVIRRDELIDHSRYVIYSNVAQTQYLETLAGWIEVSEPLYVRRMHLSPRQRIEKPYFEEYCRIVRRQDRPRKMYP